MHNVGDGTTAHPAVQHLEALTSLRFLAALYVLLYHYTGIPGSVFEGQVARLGYTGVSFFFVLSGFILAHNYHQVNFAKPSALHRYALARLSRSTDPMNLPLASRMVQTRKSGAILPTGSEKSCSS